LRFFSETFSVGKNDKYLHIILRMMQRGECKVLKMRIPPNRILRIKVNVAVAPLTLNHIERKLPMRTRIIRFQNRLIIPFPLNVKLENPSKKVKRGEVTYSILNQAIIIYLDNADLSIAETIIGEIMEEGKLNDIRSGSGVEIAMEEH